MISDPVNTKSHNKENPGSDDIKPNENTKWYHKSKVINPEDDNNTGRMEIKINSRAEQNILWISDWDTKSSLSTCGKTQ